MIKKDNERCFLPKGEKLICNSIILYELFNLEDFDYLSLGIDNLYSNVNAIDSETIEEQKKLSANSLSI